MTTLCLVYDPVFRTPLLEELTCNPISKRRPPAVVESILKCFSTFSLVVFGLFFLAVFHGFTNQINDTLDLEPEGLLTS